MPHVGISLVRLLANGGGSMKYKILTPIQNKRKIHTEGFIDLEESKSQELVRMGIIEPAPPKPREKTPPKPKEKAPPKPQETANET